MSFFEKAIEIGLTVAIFALAGYYLFPYIKDLDTSEWGTPNVIIIGAFITILLSFAVLLLFRQMRQGKLAE